MNKFKKPQPSRQDQALSYCRSLSEEEWKWFKRATDAYRKADKLLKGEDDIDDLADQLIETN